MPPPPPRRRMKSCKRYWGIPVLKVIKTVTFLPESVLEMLSQLKYMILGQLCSRAKLTKMHWIACLSELQCRHHQCWRASTDESVDTPSSLLSPILQHIGWYRSNGTGPPSHGHRGWYSVYHCYSVINFYQARVTWVDLIQCESSIVTVWQSSLRVQCWIILKVTRHKQAKN